MKKKDLSPLTPGPLPGGGGVPAVAIIGGGYWGKNLVRNFHGLNALKLISDKNDAILAGFKDQFDGIDTCFSLVDVLSRDDIEGVVIATPPNRSAGPVNAVNGSAKI